MFFCCKIILVTISLSTLASGTNFEDRLNRAAQGCEGNIFATERGTDESIEAYAARLFKLDEATLRSHVPAPSRPVTGKKSYRSNALPTLNKILEEYDSSSDESDIQDIAEEAFDLIGKRKPLDDLDECPDLVCEPEDFSHFWDKADVLVAAKFKGCNEEEEKNESETRGLFDKMIHNLVELEKKVIKDRGLQARDDMTEEIARRVNENTFKNISLWKHFKAVRAKMKVPRRGNIAKLPGVKYGGAKWGLRHRFKKAKKYIKIYESHLDEKYGIHERNVFVANFGKHLQGVVDEKKDTTGTSTPSNEEKHHELD